MMTYRFGKLIRQQSAKLAALLLMTILATQVAAQSGGSREEAMPLTRGEISGPMESAAARDYYYTFAVNPGEFVLTLDVASENSMTAYAGVTVDVFDKSSTTLLCCFLVQSSYGRSETGVKKIRIERRQTLILRLKVANGSGSYRLRLGGPVVLPEADTLRVSSSGGTDIITGPGVARTTPPATPNDHGMLRIEMGDGTVQTIPLSRVRRITIEQ